MNLEVRGTGIQKKEVKYHHTVETHYFTTVPIHKAYECVCVSSPLGSSNRSSRIDLNMDFISL
jgi:hypothetical protein